MTGYFIIHTNEDGDPKGITIEMHKFRKPVYYSNLQFPSLIADAIRVYNETCYSQSPVHGKNITYLYPTGKSRVECEFYTHTRSLNQDVNVLESTIFDLIAQSSRRNE